MFNEIGKKIQTFAKVLFILNVIITIILGFTYSTSILRSYWFSNTYVLLVIIIVVICLLFEYLSTLLLMGFGKVVEANECLRNKLSERDYFKED